MRRFYEINPIMHCSDEVEVWDDEQDEDWNGCCEDSYDEDEEENEREWCD